MGEIEGWSQMGGGGGGGGRGPLLPNGLLPNAGPLIDSLDSERWLKAEERTAELISCIQPNPPSEERRNAVADYVQRLIMKCFPCKVFTFGSVPLKTYLPDGDIDLTAFSSNANLKDSWAIEVCDLLQAEEKNENAEFHVKEVQYIQAEVKIIKCLVENIVVDISFNQLGGLCTLCFLEEVDNLINQNHLFKRSIILIKAWCYYESRILGAHHGLISTYALETLVLYIFHVFNNSFAGPLEVLYRFLEFFSKFDWDNFCVSLWGPVPINSLPDVTAEPPRKDSEELLLNKVFLDACSYVYAVFPGGQDNHGQPFLSKHFNVIDPLRVSNNLGRSVSKGNFYRIRSAFALGAKRLAKFLDCPKENLVAEVNQFFTNTWDRHGNGIRPDAPLPVTDSTVLKIDTKMSTSSGKKSETVGQESDFDHTRSTNNQSESSPKARVATPGQTNQGQRNLKSGLLVNDIQRSPFARTRSSPELTDTYKYVPFQGTVNKPPENEKTRNRRKNVETENEKNEASSLHHVPHKQSFEPSPEPNIYHREDMQQEEQDLVNIMASSSFHGFNGPVNLASGHLPFPFSPSFLASLGYTQRNIPGMIPSNMPFIDPQFAAMHFPHGLVPHYFPGVDVTSNSEDSVNENNLGSVELNSGDDNYNHEILREAERVNSEIVLQDENKPQSSSTRMNYIPPPRRVGASGGPPVPFLTMLPFYNVPSENGSSDASTSRFESTENGDAGQSFHPEGVDQVEDFSPRAAGRHETPDEHRSDILNSDFASHWQNLQFGRFCQSPLHHGPTVYPSPVMVPPVYLQGRVPWDGPGRPLPNMNLVTQLMNYGPRLVPVPPLQSVPNRPPNVYQHYVEDMPRYNRSGTGTYLPNPKVAARDRPRRGNFNYDRTDSHGDRDGNSKPRGSGRNHNHNQTDKSTARLDRLGSSGSRTTNSHRNESFSTYQTQNGPLHPGSSQSGPANVAYGMYPLPGVPPNGSDGPVVMMYPFEQNPGFASQNEPVDVGSTGPAGFSGVNDQSPRGDGSRYRGVVEEHRLYSPDQPSSPHHQRRV
ncbi:putative polynucleotide adenylyltransferase [Helianthus annuus]|nr:putative polynucleotide adenylyltransferase [Helianthus annuus]